MEGQVLARSRRGSSRRIFEPYGGGASAPGSAPEAGTRPGLAAGPGDREAPGVRQPLPVRSQRGPRTGQAGDRGGSSVGWIPVGALLPLRFFVGFTFLYAGIDKIALDTAFLDLSSPTSILAQLQGYARTSPLAPLITTIAEPNAWLMGLTIALAEIAVGLALLTGLAFRAGAVGGALLSLLFFLTASWNVHPYYFGQDLPYGFGFVTLALAGHGDRYVLGPWLERQFAPRSRTGRHVAGTAPMSPERRQLLQVGAVAVGALVIGTVVRPVRDLLMPVSAAPVGAGAGAGTVGGAASPGAGAAAGTSASSAPSGASGQSGSANQLAIASTAAVAQAGAFGFQVPIAIGNASPGDPGIVVSLGNSQFAAFDAICTHAGCTVGYDPQAGLLICPCHGAEYDPRHNGQPVAGPTNIPLTELPITIQGGEITLKA